MIAVMDPTSFFRQLKRDNVGRFVAFCLLASDLRPRSPIFYFLLSTFYFGAAFILALAAVAQAQAEQRTDKIIMSGNPAGTQTVQIEPGGAGRAEYSYNDRGRGDHIIATWKLDAAGVPIEYEGRGNDYMKAPIEELFGIKDGKASWKNRSEKGDQAVAGVLFADECATGILWSACARTAESARPQAGPAARRRSEHRGGRKSKDRYGRIDRVPNYGPWLHPAIALARP
jgi:hypothetical protein